LPRSYTSTVIEPCFVVQVSTKQVATPDKLAIVLTTDEAIVATISSGNTQEQFVLGPTITDDGITELDHPVVR